MVRDVFAFPNIELPVVERIVSVPVFSPDGTIQMEAGYNAQTRSIFLPCDRLGTIPAVPESPDSDDISLALSIFDDLVADFPFVDPGRTHTLAALLVPFVRALIKGPTPLHLFEKPEPGTGATLLAQVVCDICVGHEVASMTEAGNEDEFSRKIHSKLRAGPAAVLLDNVRNRLNSGALAAALTGDLFEDRVVQRSETAAVPVRCLWLATANNPTLSDEMVRRTIPIRLDARMRRPHLRTEFRHPNLREWVASNHGGLIWAMLTLVRAWFVAGCPKGTAKLGMYESYCQVIGGILDVAGVPGFLDIRQEQAQLAEDESDLAPLIPRWQETHGFSHVRVGELLELSEELDLEGSTENSRKIKLGKLLRANRGRRFDDVVLVEAGKQAGSKLWRLDPIAANESSGRNDDQPIETGGVGELGESFTPPYNQ